MYFDEGPLIKFIYLFIAVTNQRQPRHFFLCCDGLKKERYDPNILRFIKKLENF